MDSPLIKLQTFFGFGTRPVPMKEMAEFWKACSEAEKEGFKADVARWDGTTHFIPAAA